MGTATGCHKRVSGEDAAFHGLSAGRFMLIITDHAYRRPAIPVEHVTSRARVDPSLKAPSTYCFVVERACGHVPVNPSDS
jgi:hypothetical protein